MIIPIKNRHTLGLLYLGYKNNKETYHIEDIELLKLISKNIAKILDVRYIFINDLLLTLKNIKNPNKMRYNSLFELKQVNKIRREKSITKRDALIHLIDEIISKFKPHDCNKRSKSVIKYEILRMIFYEGASDAQIMWDLGFDVYRKRVFEKIRFESKPRYPLKNLSEYSATSERTYKRLKKDALLELKLKLEEGENHIDMKNLFFK